MALRIALFTAAAVAAVVIGGKVISAHDKYASQVPGGLSLAEFRGYEDWQTVSVSQTEDRLKVILANPAMIAAYRAGVPEGGRRFPEGAMSAKIEWNARDSTEAPSPVRVAGTLATIGFMVKDTRRFPEGGWGYAQFDFNPVSTSLVPNTSLQGNDAACGVACHNLAAARDHVFTGYGRR